MFTHHCNVALKVLSYYIILFPSLDVVSVYPLLVLTIVNNLYTVIFCKDTSQVTNSWGTFFVRLLLKFIVSLAPILVAMAISNLFVVLNYAGLMGFFICYFTPTFLQLRSQWVCKQTFSNVVLSADDYYSASSFCFIRRRPHKPQNVGFTSSHSKASLQYQWPLYDTILYHIQPLACSGGHWMCGCGLVLTDSDQSLLVFALNRWYINYAWTRCCWRYSIVVWYIIYSIRSVTVTNK